MPLTYRGIVKKASWMQSKRGIWLEKSRQCGSPGGIKSPNHHCYCASVFLFYFFRVFFSRNHLTLYLMAEKWAFNHITDLAQWVLSWRFGLFILTSSTLCHLERTPVAGRNAFRLPKFLGKLLKAADFDERSNALHSARLLGWSISGERGTKVWRPCDGGQSASVIITSIMILALMLR